MANTDVTPKKSWFEGLKAEFRKIIWPNRQDLVKLFWTLWFRMVLISWLAYNSKFI